MPNRCVTVLSALALGGTVLAQSEKRSLSFEVATIKTSKPGAQGGGIRPMPGGQTYLAQNATLRLMIKLMYRLADSQVVGGPSWLDTDLWDVNAKAERPSSVDQLHEMFQNLLADRFQLRFHKENKELSAYVLTVDKSGPKLKKNVSPEPYDIPIRPTGPGKIAATRASMQYFCWFLSQAARMPFVDKTGLDGFYDFNLDVPLPPLPSAGEERRPGGPDLGDLFAAVREQLGLKVESRKTPVEVMVIDTAQRPGEN